MVDTEPEDSDESDKVVEQSPEDPTDSSEEEVVPPPAPIDIFVKQDAGGMVDAQLLISLKPSDALLEEIAAKGMKNPHYVVTVASISEQNLYGNGPSDYYRQTSAYIVPLNRPFPYIRFARPGRNRILATVVNIRSREKEKWADKIRANNPHLVDDEGQLRPSNDWSWNYDGHYGLGTRDVIVPDGVFSAPAAWKVAWVRQFWRNTGVDDCDLRKRLWFGAVPLTLPIQLYGLIVRPLLFALALIMAKREIRPKQFFGAFWPHQGWRSSGESWWFTDSDGKDRRNIIPFLSPPVLVGVGVVFFGLPGAGYALWGKDGDTYWSYVGKFFLSVIALAALIAVLTAVGVFIVTWWQKHHPGHEETEAERLARLRRALVDVSENPDWDNLPEHQKTLRLRLANVKSKVCRPLPQ